MTASQPVLRLVLRSTRRAGLAWTLGFLALASATVAGYRQAYPTAIARRVVSAQIGSNLGFQALYGRARALETIGGFAAWRVGGLTVVIAAVWGALSATRLLRGEEEAGRVELLVGGRLSVPSWSAHALGVAVGWQLVAAASLAVGLRASGATGLGTLLVAAGIGTAGIWGVSVGALTAQLFPTRRRASLAAGAVIAVAYLLRVVADGTDRWGALRWATPFGWTEEARPFAGDRWWPLLLVVGAAVFLGGAALLGATRRDLHGAIVGDRDTGPTSSTRLRGPWSLAARLEWRSAAAWSVALATFGGVMGLLARDVAEFAARSPGYVDIARRLGIADPTGPGAFVGLANGTMVVAVAAFAATQVLAARADEADGRLDPLVAGPVGLAGWIRARVGVAAVGVVIASLATAVGSWLGTVARGGGLGLADAARGGLNMVPVAILVLGLGALAHGTVPRWTAGFAVGVVAAGYLLELVGALVRAPSWLLDLSPFHHVAPVPAVPVRWLASFVLLALGLIATTVGVHAIGRRDLASE